MTLILDAAQTEEAVPVKESTEATQLDVA